MANESKGTHFCNDACMHTYPCSDATCQMMDWCVNKLKGNCSVFNGEFEKPWYPEKKNDGTCSWVLNTIFQWMMVP